MSQTKSDTRQTCGLYKNIKTKLYKDQGRVKYLLLWIH